MGTIENGVPVNGALVAVGEVRSSLGAVEAVETQTHDIGVIVPPPDIKAIADKTAQFVAKNGEFAMTILILFCMAFCAVSSWSMSGMS